MSEPVLILKLPINISLSDDKASYIFSGANAAVLQRKFSVEYKLGFVKPMSKGTFSIVKKDLNEFLEKNRDPLAGAIRFIAENAINNS